MRACRNYHCETKGRLLADSMFYANGRVCRICKDQQVAGRNVKSGTLRMRMEKQGIKLCPVDTWSRI